MVPQSTEVHEETSLQAVIIAECEQDYGGPVHQEIPKVLVPLANTPLLDYSLEWLERCGVHEAIVYCRANHHLDAIKNHCRSFTGRRTTTVSNSGSGCEGQGLMVTVVASEDCSSVGDAMRDLYSKSLLKGDFILLQGDTVLTLDLPKLVSQHRESHAADKSAVMTCVYLGGHGGRVDNSREKATTATLMISASTGKMLHHRRRNVHCSRSTAKLCVPTELLQNKDTSDILIYPSIYDPSIAICSEAVPSLYSDNFDYGSLDSLIRGVIEQEELLGYTIKACVLEDGYAARASSLEALRRISGEVMRREAYPLVCESSLTSHRIRYTHDDFTNTYWDTSAKFPKESRVRNVAVGAGGDISPSARICDSVLGEHCMLADGVCVSNTVVMPNVSIKTNCVLENSYIGEGTVLGDGVVVPSGCVIGTGVTLAPNIKLLPGTVLSAQPPSDDFETSDAVEFGQGCRAFLIKPYEDEGNDDGEEEQDESEGEREGMKVSEEEEEEEGEEELSDEEEQHKSEFRREVLESLSTAHREGSAWENVVLEVNASRHAYNIAMEDVVVTVIQGVLLAGRGVGGEIQWSGVKGAIGVFRELLHNYVKKPRDQLLLLNGIEELAQTTPRYLPLVKGILYELNQTYDLLDDEVIVHWYQGGGAHTRTFPMLKTQLSKFIEWLEEDDESDESDGS